MFMHQEYPTEKSAKPLGHPPNMAAPIDSEIVFQQQQINYHHFRKSKYSPVIATGFEATVT